MTDQPQQPASQTLSWPRYQSHKVVEAVKIVALTAPQAAGELGRPGAHAAANWIVRVTDGGGLLDVLMVSHLVFARGVPAVGDYLVRYPDSDGYMSWSPAAVFEAGNHAIDASGGVTVFAGQPDGRQADAATLPAENSLFRKRYRKLEPSELALHDAIKDQADALASVIGILAPAVAQRMNVPVPHLVFDYTLPERDYDAANVTLALRHLEDAVYRAVKALTG